MCGINFIKFSQTLFKNYFVPEQNSVFLTLGWFEEILQATEILHPQWVLGIKWLTTFK